MMHPPLPVRPLQSIAAATDLSEPARLACERAAQLARQHGARLTLVHMVTLGLLDRLRLMAADDAEQLDTMLVGALKADVQLLADELAAQRHVAAEVVVGRQPLLAGLLAEVRSAAAELLVLGPQGAGHVRHAVLGTTAERLVGRSPVPVLIARQANPTPYRQVLVPVDFSPASQAAVAAARQLAPGAQLVLLHAFQVPFEGKMRLAGVEESQLVRYELHARQTAHDQMQALLTACGLDATMAGVSTVVAHGEPTRLILAYAEETGADLIVVGKGEASALEDMLLGSVTRHVLVEAEIDVLVAG